MIESVDGEDVAARAVRLRPYVKRPPSSQRGRHSTALRCWGLFAGPVGSSVTLRLRGADGRLRDVRTARVALQLALHARTRPVVEVLAGNVGYVDLQRLDVAGVDPMFKQLASTRAIVFDLRGYPRGTRRGASRRTSRLRRLARRCSARR